MPTLTEIREGLAANIAAEIADIQASAYMLTSPTLPAVEVQPSETEYDRSFQRGLDRWVLIVRVLAGLASDIGAQKILDPFLAPSGPKSIKAAIESDDTLGGAVEGLRVTRCTGYRQLERTGQGPMLCAEWTVEVWAEGVA